MKYTLLIALCLFSAAFALLKDDFDSCTNKCKINRDIVQNLLVDPQNTKNEFAEYKKCAFNEDPQNGETIDPLVLYKQRCKDLAAITDFADSNIKTFRKAVSSCDSDCMDFSEEENQYYEDCTDKCLPILIADQKIKTTITCLKTCRDQFFTKLATLSDEEQAKILAVHLKHISEKACQDSIISEEEFEDPSFFQKLFECQKAVYTGVQLTKTEEEKITCQAKCMSDSGSTIKWSQVNSFSENSQIMKFAIVLLLTLCSLLL